MVLISPRTLTRRKGEDRLPPDESERAYRLARLIELAAEVLGGPDEAKAWMKEPNLALGEKTPLEMARTEPGAELVERVLGQIEHGIPCITATFSDRHIEALDADDLPEGWNALPYARVSQEVDDRWLEERRSLVLRIPSVVVPQEYNYLIHPLHDAFPDIEIGDPFPVPFDRRLER